MAGGDVCLKELLLVYLGLGLETDPGILNQKIEGLIIMTVT
jgi:hypothetical protein